MSNKGTMNKSSIDFTYITTIRNNNIEFKIIIVIIIKLIVKTYYFKLILMDNDIQPSKPTIKGSRKIIYV